MQLAPSGREMADIAVRHGALDLAQGVIHSNPPARFFELLEDTKDRHKAHVYASPAGNLPYRESLLKILQEERSSLTLDSLMGASGVTGGLVSALATHGKPGDAVLLFEPFYPAHDWAIRSLSRVPYYVPYRDDLSVDWEILRRALPRVKVVLVANPANPTGLVLRPEEVTRLYELCRQHDVLLIVDEVYRDFVWEGQFVSLLSLAKSLENVVVLRSFSKNLGLAGWRVGFAITAPQRLAAMTRAHDALYVGAPAMPQVVLATLLSEFRSEVEEFVRSMIALYRTNRQIVQAVFQEIGMLPHPQSGAYYMLVAHQRESDTAAMEELLSKGVAVAPGVPFWRPGTRQTGYIRLHFALAPENIEELRTRLSRKAAA